MINKLYSPSGDVTQERVNKIAKSNPSELIEICENRYKMQIDETCKEILSDKKNKIVLLAGPSGSGKTTTARKLKEKFAEHGVKAVSISLDDFFKNREDLPILENGETDFESVNTLDVEEIRKCFAKLLGGEPAVVPYFDFISGKRDNSRAQTLETDDDDIIIVEGLHAINPKLTDGIEAFGNKGFFKLFVNPLSQIHNEEGQTVLKRRNIRMMRRMIRDYLFRGSSFANTLKMWEGVCREEIQTIIPFKDSADRIIDTTHFYEPCIYHHFILPIMEKSEITEQKHIETMQDIVKRLEDFYDLTPDIIPADSMIREFIGEK